MGERKRAGCRWADGKLLEKCCSGLYGLGGKVILFFALLSAGVLLICNLLQTCRVGYNLYEVVEIEGTSVIAILFAAAGLGILLILQEKLSFLKERDVFRFFMILYLIAGIYWILNISTMLRADAMHVRNGALLSAQGDFSFLELGQDIRNHPWQLGMITYERLLGKFSKNVQLLFLVNLFMILGINYMTYRLADLVFSHNHRTNLLTILFTFAFLPQFFFLAFAYGLIPGFFFLTGGFYFQQRYFAEKKNWQAAVCIVMTVTAVVLKGNNLAGGIAMALLFFMRLLKEQKVRYLLMALVLMACIQASSPLMIAAYERESGIKLNSGEPKLLYIAMGIWPENRENGAGRYCGYNDYTFGQANFDPETANEMAKEHIGESIAHYMADPKDATVFFSKKLVTLWCDPLFQSLWSGPLSDAGQTVDTRILESLYHGEKLEGLAEGYMKSFLILLLALACAYILNRTCRSEGFWYALLYAVGGFLLHIVWEAKSQYTYPYVFVLIPGCARALAGMGDFIPARVNQFLHRVRLRWKKEGEEA